jgi:hypothetical protein
MNPAADVVRYHTVLTEIRRRRRARWFLLKFVAASAIGYHVPGYHYVA